jgi:hypothetical protein
MFVDFWVGEGDNCVVCYKFGKAMAFCMVYSKKPVVLSSSCKSLRIEYKCGIYRKEQNGYVDQRYLNRMR